MHFRRDWLTPAALGGRAFRVAVSDIAACGADPRFVLLALSAPASYPARDALALVRGLIRDAATVGVALVGGNLSAGPVLSLTVTVIGEAGARLLTRDAARVGDTIYVTGRLGGAAAALRVSSRRKISARSRGGRRGAPSLAAYLRPPLRVAAGRALVRSRFVGATIDVSDGLIQDLGHVCESSGVSAEMDLTTDPGGSRRDPRRRALRRRRLRAALYGATGCG